MSDEKIDISGLDHAELLAALYNAAMPLGLGALHYDPKPMTKAEAAELVEKHRRPFGRVSFDYVKGRPLKVWFEGDKLSGAWLYDRDQGDGKCAQIVDDLRARPT